MAQGPSDTILVAIRITLRIRESKVRNPDHPDRRRFVLCECILVFIGTPCRNSWHCWQYGLTNMSMQRNTCACQNSLDWIGFKQLSLWYMKVALHRGLIIYCGPPSDASVRFHFPSSYWVILCHFPVCMFSVSIAFWLLHSWTEWWIHKCEHVYAESRFGRRMGFFHPEFLCRPQMSVYRRVRAATCFYVQVYGYRDMMRSRPALCYWDSENERCSGGDAETSSKGNCE